MRKGSDATSASSFAFAPPRKWGIVLAPCLAGCLLLGTSCGLIENTPGDVFVMGDLSTVGATLFIDGKRIRTLAANRDSSLWQFNVARSIQHQAEFHRWMVFRDSLGLGESDELRLRDRAWGRKSEWTRVTEDARGRVKTTRLGNGWVTMQFDSMVVHEHLHGCLKRFARANIVLVSATGESLSVGIHAYKYPAVTASFSQRRIESDSWEESSMTRALAVIPACRRPSDYRP